MGDVLAAAVEDPAVQARARDWAISLRRAGIATEANERREAAALINEAYKRARVAQANAEARDPGFTITNPVGFLIRYLGWVGQDALKLRTVTVTDPQDPASPLMDDRAAAHPGGRYRQEAHAGLVTHWRSGTGGPDPFTEAARRHQVFQARRFLVQRRSEIWDRTTGLLGAHSRGEGIWAAAGGAVDWLLAGDGAMSVHEIAEQELGRSGDWWSGSGLRAETLAKRIRRDRPWVCYVVWEAVLAVTDREDTPDRTLLLAVTAALHDDAGRRAKAPDCPGQVAGRLAVFRAELGELLAELAQWRA